MRDAFAVLFFVSECDRGNLDHLDRAEPVRLPMGPQPDCHGAAAHPAGRACVMSDAQRGVDKQSELVLASTRVSLLTPFTAPPVSGHAGQ
jgi:hypothetical protein